LYSNFVSKPNLDTDLLVSPDRLDFGEAWEDSRFDWQIPIENSLNHEIVVVDFEQTCNCITIEPRSLVIPAREIRELKLTLDLTAKRSKSPEREWRDFEVSISPRLLGDPESLRRAAWTIRGRVHTAVFFREPVLDLGVRSEMLQPLHPVTASVSSFVPIKALEATCDAGPVEVHVKHLQELPQRFEVVLAPSVLPVGAIDSRISVVPVLMDGTRSPPKALQVVGRILSDLRTSPPEITLGTRSIGERVEETLTVYSLTDRRFQVVSVHGENEDSRVEKCDVERTGNPVFLLKQRITQAGQYSGNITFEVQADGKRITIVSGVSYYGLAH
jgi:hypothetical protein